MSVTLEHGNNKLVVKLAPTKQMRFALEEFCTKFKVDPNEWQLSFKKKEVDLGTQFRLAGIPTNGKVDVVKATTSEGKH